MNTKLFFGTLLAATALAAPAFADDPSKDLTTFSISENDPSITLTNGSRLGYSLSVSGDGTAVISCDAIEGNPATIGGITSSSGKTFVQLNGGGYLNVSGTVSLAEGGYINYQGSTTFTGTATLGELELYQESDTICDVVFTGSSAQATVGTITVDQSGGSLTATLTVEKGAKLTVTDALVINDNFAITIDAGTMAIGGSASGDSSANITIENGGQLSVTSNDISLNNATITIILSEENLSTTGNAVYALIGDGSLKDVTIKITVDEALAELLGSGEGYTFDIYDSGLTFDTTSVTWNLEDLTQYGYSWNGDGTITTGVAAPEPSAFGLLFGLGTLALTATRRRRRKVA